MSGRRLSTAGVALLVSWLVVVAALTVGAQVCHAVGENRLR